MAVSPTSDSTGSNRVDQQLHSNHVGARHRGLHCEQLTPPLVGLVSTGVLQLPGKCAGAVDTMDLFVRHVLFMVAWRHLGVWLFAA